MSSSPRALRLLEPAVSLLEPDKIMAFHSSDKELSRGAPMHDERRHHPIAAKIRMTRMTSKDINDES